MMKIIDFTISYSPSDIIAKSAETNYLICLNKCRVNGDCLSVIFTKDYLNCVQLNASLDNNHQLIDFKDFSLYLKKQL